VHLSTKANEDPKAKESGLNAPFIEATVIGGAPPDLAKLSLTQTDEKPAAVTIKASALKKYTEGPESIGIVVLVEGHELWMGNESYADDADKAVGVYAKLGAAFDPISKAGPPGSKGELIIYGKGATVKQALIDLTQLTGDKLGAQKDYQGTTTRELIAGVNQAYADLQKMSTSRKALIVIGDGTDTNPDAAKPQLADLKKKFEAAHVEVFGIYYQVEGFDGDATVIKALVGGSLKTANSMDNIAAQASAIVGELQNRYYATFPGFDPKLNAGFTWDGKDHTFSLKIDQDENDAGSVTMLPQWQLPVPHKFPWLWVILGGIVGLILLLVIIAKVAGGKKVQPPAPMVVQQPVAAPAAPPPPAAPAAPMKTMMVNLNAGDDGWPVVAWLVPLNGPNQFQTFKLGGTTVIGTGGGAHVVVNDGFMSTEHAMIVASPNGYVLKDKGSTNGVLVNERRVTDHELVDNDVILMGKTNFKFKTTI
jgi:hypothetical protein